MSSIVSDSLEEVRDDEVSDSDEQAPQEDSMWYEDVAQQVVEADQKIVRLMQLKSRMLALPCFDKEDVESVEASIHAAEQRIDAIHQAVSKAQWRVIVLFITLKRREAFLEQAVADKLLLPSPEADGLLFQSLVQKQVYLTRLAHEKAE